MGAPVGFMQLTRDRTAAEKPGVLRSRASRAPQVIDPRARRLGWSGLIIVLGCAGPPTFNRSNDSDAGGDNRDGPVAGQAGGTGGSGTGGDTVIGTGGDTGGGTGGGGGLAGSAGSAGSGGRAGTGGSGTGGMPGSGGRSGTGGAPLPGTGGMSATGGAGGLAGMPGIGGGGAGMGGAGGSVASGLVLYYSFDHNSGTNVADGSGNSRNGMLVGTASFATGRKGNALSLNATNGSGGAGGATGGHVIMPMSVVSNLNAATVSLWLNVRAHGNWPRVFEIATSTSRYMALTSSVDTSGMLRFTIRMTAGTGNDQVLEGPVLPTNTWKHVAVVLSGSPGGGALYVDGTQVDNDTAVTLRPSDLGATTMNWLGRSQYATDTYFNGLLDELRIYNRALTAGEIMALFSSP